MSFLLFFSLRTGTFPPMVDPGTPASPFPTVHVSPLSTVLVLALPNPLSVGTYALFFFHSFLPSFSLASGDWESSPPGFFSFPTPRDLQHRRFFLELLFCLFFFSFPRVKVHFPFPPPPIGLNPGSFFRTFAANSLRVVIFPARLL